MPSILLGDLSERYFFLDPASGKTNTTLKRTRARSAIVGVATDALARVFVLHAWAERCSTAKLIDVILDTQLKYRPRVFGIEANAQQSLFCDAVALEAKHRGINLPIVPVTQSTKIDKMFRIRAALQSMIANGRLFIQPHQYELEHEITSFPMSPTYDLVDALASVCSLVPARAQEVRRGDESAALASYLRKSGAPPEYIEARCRALRDPRDIMLPRR